MARTEGAHLAKGIVAGLAGGLVATAVMTIVQTGLQKALAAGASGGHENDAEGEDDGASSATEVAAQKIATGVTGEELERPALDHAAQAVHWAFGTLAGGAFGAAAEGMPKNGRGTDALQGVGWGTGVWALGDEAAVPALGLAEPPWKQDPSTHLYALAAHLVYGATLGLVTRAVRRLLDGER